MYEPLEETTLYKALNGRTDLQGKILDLRNRVDRYLRSSNNLFPHYTSHGVDHSDHIIRQLSNLLIADGRDLILNDIELYLLIAAAYLHDTGMVVTDHQSREVLESDAWERFKQDNEEAKADALNIEAATPPSSPDAKVFLAGFAQKLLLASWFRSRHADRAELAINGELRVGETLLNGDPAAVQTLVDICQGHGVSRASLYEEGRYPTRRDLFGKSVNVRLLTVLLRIGDLLDMRPDRACSELRAGADPMPMSSTAHWTQYQRITNLIVSPERIELAASCMDADEHRLLADWCDWLVGELDEAPSLLRLSPWESRWTPPLARTEAPKRTITIGRAPGAKYRPHQWVFEIDKSEILKRLIHDIQVEEFGWLRELIQNGLDANRAMLQIKGWSGRYTNEAPKRRREVLPVRVSFRESAEGSTDQIILEDSGLGMQSATVRDYFLQIGRSWYRSPEFTKDHSFAPSSRFGVGFLSVFGVSDDVRVTTRWHKDAEEDALHFQMRGPERNLLFEDAIRSTPGTSIEVNLREPLSTERVTKALEMMAGNLEFPVKLAIRRDGKVQKSTLRPTTADPVVFQVDPDTQYSEMHVPAGGNGVFGHFSFFAFKYASGREDWTFTEPAARRSILDQNPLAEIPRLQPSWIALNGLVHDSNRPGGREPVHHHLDVREHASLDGSGLDRNGVIDVSQYAGHLVERLDRHLALGAEGAEYAQRVVVRFAHIVPDWAASVKCWPNLQGTLMSYQELADLPEFVLIRSFDAPYGRRSTQEGATRRAALGDAHIAMKAEYSCLSNTLRDLQHTRLGNLHRRRVSQVHVIDAKNYAITLSLPASFRQTAEVMPFTGDSAYLYVQTPQANVINSDHPVYELLSKAGKPALKRFLGLLNRRFVPTEDVTNTVAAIGHATSNEQLVEWSAAIKSQGNMLNRDHVRVELPART
ncbi:ATP-binding protein [Curtobacterium flaccumfaciens]|uniref:HD domain-containing protein n=1 Tax=Curtobacterium flaccumfaciens TaxID=2035 RepID=UPI00217D21DB|nr:ATP-binding protein [Curtobacterium flaccumfaciens]MCS6554185.1 ATP-binding protein [Curtobacterium flaccumfaciens]